MPRRRIVLEGIRKIREGQAPSAHRKKKLHALTHQAPNSVFQTRVSVILTPRASDYRRGVAEGNR